MYDKAQKFATVALASKDSTRKTSAAQAMILWHDFMDESPYYQGKRLAKEALALAEKLSPGISKIDPRVPPEDETVPLPPPPGEGVPPDEAGSGNGPPRPGNGGPGNQGGPGGQGRRGPGQRP
jgi:hypothetical protein